MTGSIGANLGHCSFYEPTGLLYADCMRVAQNFYGGADAAGNPTVSGQKIIIWQNLSAAAGAGVYQFVATGKCSLALGPTTVSGVTISAPQYDATKNQTTQTVTVPPANWPSVSQLGLQVNWASTDAPPVNLQLWRPGSPPGDLFWKPFLPLLAPFSTIRFMDTLATNGSTLADWSKRPTPSLRNYPSGIAWEDAVALCQQTKKDGWLCIPYLVANDPMQMQAVGQWLAANIPSGSAQHYYVEISNEVWNGAFPQWKQNQTAAASNVAAHFDGMTDPNILGWRQTAYLAVQFAQAIAKAYGVANWRQTPIRPVLGVQWGNPGVAQYGLQFIQDRYGPPAQFLYAIADAPYCTVDWSKNPQTAADLDADLLTGNPNNPLAQANASLARYYGVKITAYEFGFDFGQNPANNAIRDQAQSLPQIAPQELAALSAWAQGGGGLLNYYQLAYQNQPSGDWGLVQDPMSDNTPKYQAVAQAAQLMWWDDAPLPLPVTASPTPAPAQTPPLLSTTFTDSAGKKLSVTISA